MRSDNMMMVHANNHYHYKNQAFEGTQISAGNTYKAPIEVENVGKTEQAVTVQGKNLWSSSSYYYAHTGVGFTSIDSGSFTLPINFHGTFTLSANITRYSDDAVTNPRFSIKVFYTDGTSNAFAGFFNNIPADGAEHFVYITGTSDVAKTIDHIGGWLFDYSSSTFRHIEARNIQLELGSTATTYESFIPNSPSPDYPSPIQKVLSGTRVNVVGRNLFDRAYSAMQYSTYVDSGNVITVTTSTSLGTSRVVYKLSLSKNTNYSVTLNVKYTLGVDNKTDAVVLVRETNSGGTVFSELTVPRTSSNVQKAVLNFNSGNYNTLYLWLYPRSSGTDSTIVTAEYSDIQLITGTYTAETLPVYQPYQSGGSALSEYDLYAGDKWNMLSGQYAFEKAVYEFTGNEPVVSNINANGIRVFSVDVSAGSFSNYPIALCSNYRFEINYSVTKDGSFYMSKGGVCIFFDNRFTTSDGFKAFLATKKAAGTPVTVVHERATPLVIEGTARLISSVPRHTNIYSVPASGGLVPIIKTTMKTY